MKKLIQLAFCLIAVQQGLAQSVYDCNVYNPLVTQAEIMAVPYEYNKQCVLFDQQNYSFSGNLNRMVSAATSIHLKPGVHIGPFTGNGAVVLTIKDQKEFDVAVMNYADLNNVLKFEKLELGITLPADILEKVNNFVNNAAVGVENKLNPYLDWDTRVYAEFRPADADFPFVIDGFYTKEFTPWNVTTLPPLGPGQQSYSEADYKALGGYIENPTDYPFRVRFAPNKIGKWKALVKIEVDGVLVHTSSVFEFNVVESGNPGYVRVGINKRYLRREGTFYPLGCNLNWPETDDVRDPELAAKLTYFNGNEDVVSNEGYMNNVAVPRVYDKYRDYMNLLADGGANYYRSIMYPASTEIEWEHLGDYTKRLSMAQEMDEIVNTAKARDLFIHWNMQIHYSFQYSDNAFDRYWCWQSGMQLEGTTHNFAYRSLVESDNPVDFFTDSDAKDYYKQRLRYILARWGYSTNVAVWELFSEISNVGAGASDGNEWYLTGTNWERYRDWQVEMANYLKTMYHGQCHLVTASYGSIKHQDDNTFQYPSMDIMTSNIYDYAEPSFGKFFLDNVAGDILNDASGLSYSYQNTKPMLFSETDPIDAMCDNTKLEGHRAIWQSVFSGLAGSLSWDMQKHPQHFGIYGQIRNFMDGIDFDAGGWHPGASIQNSVYDLDFSTFPPTNNGLLSTNWSFNYDYAKYMDGLVDPSINSNSNDPIRVKKGDFIYLRSGDKNFAIGVLTNKTRNIKNSATCYDGPWPLTNSNLEEPIYGYDTLDISMDIKAKNEDLFLTSLSGNNNKYYIEYHDNGLSNSYVLTQGKNQDNLLQLKLNFGDYFPGEYIVPVKVRRKNYGFPQTSNFQLIEDTLITQVNNRILLENADSVKIFGFDVFPNPVTTELNVVNQNSDAPYKIIISTIDNRTLYTLENFVGKETFDFSEYNSGIYILKVFQNGQHTEMIKIIKL
jgi:hypothetical protein